MAEEGLKPRHADYEPFVQWKSEIQHNRKLNDLRTRSKIAE